MRLPLQSLLGQPHDPRIPHPIAITIRPATRYRNDPAVSLNLIHQESLAIVGPKEPLVADPRQHHNCRNMTKA